MALIGGGGAGNVAGGSNPSGVGTSLNYTKVGDKTWCYAYSGTVSINNETKTALEFSTGNEVINAKFTYGINLNAMYTSKFIGFIITLNGSIIMKSILDDNTQEGFDNDPVRLILPPYSRVKIESITDSATENETYAVITGRVYA